jgi:hypothetical protein
MVFVEGDDYRRLRRPGDDPAQFRSVVRPAQVPVAPDSVVHQYRGENFTTSTWADTAPSGPQADMSITGVSASTLNGSRTASSDGVDDFATSPLGTVETLPSNPEFSVALVFKAPNANGSTAWMGAESGNGSRFRIVDNDFFDNSDGELEVLIRDTNNNPLAAGTDVNVCDSKTHLVVVNRDSSGFEFYVDTMSGPAPSTQFVSQGFSSANYSNGSQMHFFARQDAASGLTGEKQLRIPFVEFNADTYSQQDRLDLLQRAPGL